MIRYPGHAFVGAVVFLATAVGASLWMIWAMEAWEAAGVGIILGVCLVIPPVAIWQWQHDDRLAEETLEVRRASRLAADGFAAARIEKARASMEEFLASELKAKDEFLARERAEDAVAMIAAANALDRVMERNNELERLYHPFDWRLRLRKAGKWTKTERSLSHDDSGKVGA